MAQTTDSSGRAPQHTFDVSKLAAGQQPQPVVDGTKAPASGVWVSPDFDKPMKLVDDEPPVPVEVPAGFQHADALQRVARLVVELLNSGMPEREIAKRLMRYHPAMEGA